MDAYRDEIFGPVLTVMRVDTYDEAVKLVNDNPYGNGTAIFTRDGGAARQFQFEVNAGHGRHQRADPGPGRVLQLRRLEGVALRRPAHVRPRGHPVLHAGQDRHLALAGPRDRRRSTSASRAPAEPIDDPDDPAAGRRRPRPQRPPRAPPQPRWTPRPDARPAPTTRARRSTPRSASGSGSAAGSASAATRSSRTRATSSSATSPASRSS